MPPELSRRPVLFESSEYTFASVAERAAKKFQNEPFFYYTTPSGETYTSAMTVDAAVHRTIVELGLVDDEARSLHGNLTAELMNTHPDFAQTTFARWGAYSNRGRVK